MRSVGTGKRRSSAFDVERRGLEQRIWLEHDVTSALNLITLAWWQENYGHGPRFQQLVWTRDLFFRPRLQRIIERAILKNGWRVLRGDKDENRDEPQKSS